MSKIISERKGKFQKEKEIRLGDLFDFLSKIQNKSKYVWKNKSKKFEKKNEMFFWNKNFESYLIGGEKKT